MKHIAQATWHRFTSSAELQLRTTLLSGQNFYWREVGGNWRGVINQSVLSLKQDDTDVFFQQHDDKMEPEKVQTILTDYFQLEKNLSELYPSWGNDKPEAPKSQRRLRQDFQTASQRILGLRLMRQDPIECLFSFICSQNNNIPRIKSLVEKICRNYGTNIQTIDDVDYFSFPSLEQLSAATEKELQDLGFGYRAKYIVKSTQQVIEKGGREWLLDLRTKTYEETQTELLSLHGVGRKVADCMSLCSLDQLDVVPVDTHVFQIAQRYMPKLDQKKLNASSYNEIRKFFQDTFGPCAGWAHVVMFASELSTFKDSKEGDEQEEEDEEEDEKKIEKKKKDTPKKKLESKQSKTKTNPKKRVFPETKQTKTVGKKRRIAK